jgi:alpha-L-rhamnosidase
MRKIILYSLFLLQTFLVYAQKNPIINPKLYNQVWASHWITCPDVPLQEYGIYHFRKTFALSAKPQTYIVHVSADNRYKFYVNGKEIAKGPARSDAQNWHYETLDLAPYLTIGKNVLAAQVWNMGAHKPLAQHSVMAALMVQGNDAIGIRDKKSSENREGVINSDNTWKVVKNEAITPYSTDNMSKLRTYMVVGCGDAVDGTRYPWGWETVDYDDSKWRNARQLEHPMPQGCGSGANWHITPRTIPLMSEKEQRFFTIRRFDAAVNLPINTDLLRGSQPLVIPENTDATILLDQSYLMVGYPMLKISGGKGATIELEYAEALIDKTRNKGNRNEIEGKTINGNTDIFTSDGGNNRTFTTLWIRTFRYVELKIKTKDKALTINDIYSISSTYPLEEKASFSSNDASLKDVWNVGWRTARLCAGETYFDCPYYEQLQYVGDTRIQALISLYVSGDDRLVRKAITDIHNSMTPEGLTQSRYPSNTKQMIPPFSLYWVCMIYDYWMHNPDDAFVKQFLPAVERVLLWYEDHIDAQKSMLGGMEWWNYVDWTDQWKWDETYSIGGIPEGARLGNSATLTLQYVYTLQLASKVLAHYGKTNTVTHYQTLMKTLREGTYKNCFDVKKGILADSPLKKQYSQHVNIMGVLAEAFPKQAEQTVLQQIMKDTALVQASFYYRFYLTQALKKAGLNEQYYAQLAPWRDMLKIGLTTFAEKPEPSRSDCHAWSASPNYDFLATICGIMPLKAGFKEVLIQPALGELTTIQGKMPHPLGFIEVNLEKKGTHGIMGSINLPKGLTGIFIWKNKKIILKEGIQKVEL